MIRKAVLVFWALLVCTNAYAAHPLITDDTGTQGKGKTQFEFIAEYEHDSEDGVSSNSLTAPTLPVISYGLTDTMDLVLGISYLSVRTKEDGETSREKGISDTSLEVKWRFYEKDGLSFALKPGITLPTGDEDKGLGAGRVTYGVFLIGTKEMKPWAVHVNAGYLRNENKVEERKDLWHASLAAEVAVLKDLRAVANIGVERNPDPALSTAPAFILGGLIYSLSENIDLDAGIKGGLNRPEADYAVLAGITVRL
ncbi:MAG: transporter [Alphaproteobacteria bacterium]|uniref:Transporter n=1 Tax=Candidatus Nitrobium versatile TaxID=2884831 RepID=A0A953SHR6_9BACT|nr:transporter [Candidatus Nitrobium versatile]